MGLKVKDLDLIKCRYQQYYRDLVSSNYTDRVFIVVDMA